MIVVNLLLIFQDSHLFWSHRQQWMKAPQKKLNEKVMNSKQPPSYKHNINHGTRHIHTTNLLCATLCCDNTRSSKSWRQGWRGAVGEGEEPLSPCFGFPITAPNWDWRDRKTPLSIRPGQSVPAHTGSSQGLHAGKVSEILKSQDTQWQ